ncbi:hypothetical protein FOL47_009711 [Perkinsus chesapeaki]|uniref:F-box domain-containing protein n=1 Tax=Perkinsus chesapeaki TaxID=330153 RepID=A0A7J6L6N9_PERCH|nr:hypothetical protein FOL47_009711 [Perkinsus chesapeaki]
MSKSHGLHLESLPPEILLDGVFPYLSAFPTIMQLRQVCRRFKFLISTSARSFRHLDLSSGLRPSKVFLNLVGPYVNSIHLVTPAYLLLKNLPRLHYLELTHLSLPPDTYERYKQAFAALSLPSVRHFRCRSRTKTTSDEIAAMLRVLPGLVSVNLALRITEWHEAAGECFNRPWKKLVIRIRLCPAGDASASLSKSVCSAVITSRDTLEDFRYDFSFCSIRDYYRIVAELRASTVIRRLALTGLQWPHYVPLLDAIAQLKTLRRLSLVVPGMILPAFWASLNNSASQLSTLRIEGGVNIGHFLGCHALLQRLRVLKISGITDVKDPRTILDFALATGKLRRLELIIGDTSKMDSDVRSALLCLYWYWHVCHETWEGIFPLHSVSEEAFETVREKSIAQGWGRGTWYI